MVEFYHISAKKAMLLLLAVFLFIPVPSFARTSTDPRYFEQQTIFSQINAPAAWETTVGSRAVIVAVIDTGFDTAHEDLQANTWTNPREIAGNGIDDDRNGYIDDVHGWNFVENNNNTQTPVDISNGTIDAANHGSLVAGLIGAVGENGLDGTGLNWQVSLMPLRAISNSGSGTTGGVINAINYAIDNGAQILNMSFVGDIDDGALKQSFFRAYEHGIVVVAAAGNNRVSGKGNLDTYPEYPACFDRGDTTNWILGVTSVNTGNELSRFANFGSCVDLVAPGENIFSTERYAPESGFTKTFGGSFNGTSFSAPLVSGAAALIKSIRPDWTAPQIINNLLSTADAVDVDNPGLVGKLGYGRLNIGRAIQMASIDIPASPLVTVMTSVPVTTTLNAPLSQNEVLPPPAVLRKFFYLSGSQLFSLDVTTGKKIFLGTLGAGKVVDFNTHFDEGAGTTDLAVLTKTGLAYSVAIFDENGVPLEDFVVAKNVLAANKNITLQSVRLMPTVAGVRQVALLGFDNRKKTTQILIQNLGESNVSKTVQLNGAAVRFDVGSSGQTIAVAQLINKKLSVTQIDSATLKKSVWSLGAVDNLSDLRVGKISGANHDLVALAVTKENKNLRIIVDISTESYWRDVLPTAKKGEVWKIWLADTAAQGVLDSLFWKTTGGTFAVTDSRGNLLRTVQLPPLGTSMY